MIAPRLRISLDSPPRSYAPGETLAGQFTLDGVPADEVKAIELSVLWHTDGKGEEDLSVHHFERIEPKHGEDDLRQPHVFRTVLPNSPLSYRGLIVKIGWCVRVRVFFARGKELTREIPFQLGSVPHPVVV